MWCYILSLCKGFLYNITLKISTNEDEGKKVVTISHSHMVQGKMSLSLSPCCFYKIKLKQSKFMWILSNYSSLRAFKYSKKRMRRIP